MTGNLTITKGMVCECGNLKTHARAEGCPECIRLNAEHFDHHKPSMRIRRLLAHADWMGASDVFVALNVESGRDSIDREAYSQAFRRLVSAGILERRVVLNGETQYRAVEPLPSLAPIPCVFVGDVPVIKKTKRSQLAWRKSKRAARMAAGTCRECDRPKGEGVLCDHHAELARKQYHARRVA